ncbi:MAG: acyl-CoA dehydrogenase family protein [Acidimicrobiales bacterium]
MATTHPLLTRARALQPLVRERAAAAERAAGPDAEVVRAMAAAGLFATGVPGELGGPACDPLTSIAVIDAVAQADGATGWVLMIGTETTGIGAMHLPGDTARTVVGDHPDVVICGALNPQGRAQAVPGGFVVDGRWPFASGAQRADWFWAQCVVVDGEPTREVLEVLLPRQAYDIELTWNAPGLRGSGSHDVVTAGTFVPDSHVTRTRAARPGRGGALAALPVTSRLAYNKVGVATGITRAAIDHFVELATSRVPRFSRAPLAERPRAQRALAEAEAALGGARGFVADAVGAVWDTVVAGGRPDTRQQALVRLACSHAVEACARAVTGLYESAGTAMSDADHPLARCFRDIHVVGQHLMVSPHAIDDAGRVLLGLEPLSPVF